jgi:pimeloyl-ACP methyl ester carboxylesterase
MRRFDGTRAGISTPVSCCLHAVIGGEGPPLLLVHDGPETAYAWCLMMPALAQDFEVIAVDQRGMGLSDKPAGGYNTGAQLVRC